MRRKRYWWGYGNWEVVGTASKVVEAYGYRWNRR